MRDRLIRSLNLAVAIVAMAASGNAQEMGVRRAEPARPPVDDQGPAMLSSSVTQRQVLIDPNKRLGPGDQVSIEIVEDREGPASRLITATGDLEVPPLDRVHIAGKTTSEAATEIKRKLEADYYYHATVRLSIDRVNVSAAMGKILVSGMVRSPGVLQFNLADPIMLSEAILKTGNFTDFAQPKKVEVTRTRNGAQQKFVVDVLSVQRDGAAEKDMRLEDGDRVYIPKAFVRWN